MPNRPYAFEWLNVSKHNLDTAKLLFKENHYTDIIGVEIQQATEKAIKALIAYHNIKIPRDHDLVKLYFMIERFLPIAEEDIVKLRIISDFYKDDRYPNPRYMLPTKEEISETLAFSDHLFHKILEIMGIQEDELK